MSSDLLLELRTLVRKSEETLFNAFVEEMRIAASKGATSISVVSLSPARRERLELLGLKVSVTSRPEGIRISWL